MYSLDHLALQLTDNLLVRSSCAHSHKCYTWLLPRLVVDWASYHLHPLLQADPGFRNMQPISQHFAMMPLMHSEDISKHEVLLGLVLLSGVKTNP
jgi:Bacterial protein of unknown function (DUF924)